LRIAVVAGIAAAVAALAVAAYYSFQPFSTTHSAIVSYSAGDFTVSVIEDSSSRFLARLENNGPALSPAAAFAVKKGLNSNCEAQGIVVSNFKVDNKAGKPVPAPDSIPANSEVTLDSSTANLGNMPTGDGFETAVYVFTMQPDSLLASELVQKIPIRELGAGEQELFEDCLQSAGRGYPLLIKVANPQPGSQTYFTLTDGAGNRYESALVIDKNARRTAELFWPPSRDGWLESNFTRQSGPAPAWREAPELTLSVKTISAAGTQEFRGPVSPEMKTATLDFVQVAKGNSVPAYPKFWEIRVDMESQ
jgi:hypothetical protein